MSIIRFLNSPSLVFEMTYISEKGPGSLLTSRHAGKILSNYNALLCVCCLPLPLTIMQTINEMSKQSKSNKTRDRKIKERSTQKQNNYNTSFHN